MKSKIFIFKRDAMLWILIALLTLPHLNPGYLNQSDSIFRIIDICRIISFGVLLVWLLMLKRKASLIVGLIAVLEIYIFIVTFMRGGRHGTVLRRLFLP